MTEDDAKRAVDLYGQMGEIDELLGHIYAGPDLIRVSISVYDRDALTIRTADKEVTGDSSSMRDFLSVLEAYLLNNRQSVETELRALGFQPKPPPGKLRR